MEVLQRGDCEVDLEMGQQPKDDQHQFENDSAGFSASCIVLPSNVKCGACKQECPLQAHLRSGVHCSIQSEYTSCIINLIFVFAFIFHIYIVVFLFCSNSNCVMCLLNLCVFAQNCVVHMFIYLVLLFTVLCTHSSLLLLCTLVVRQQGIYKINQRLQQLERKYCNVLLVEASKRKNITHVQ